MTDQELLASVKALAPDSAPKPKKAAVAEAETVPLATTQSLVTAIEKLVERVDRGEEGAAAVMKQVLADHGLLLKQNLSPENRLHPDISDLNPFGERDHPRPALKRQCFWVGIPLERAQLTWGEIDLLNSIPGSLEMSAPTGGGKWQVALLRDASGAETLHISTPARSRDDLNIEGGWQRVLRDLLASGRRPNSNALMEEQLATMRAEIDALKTPAAPPA